MAEIVPKKAAPPKGSNVRSIRSAGHAGGRTSSIGYDPRTGEEFGAKGYRAAESRESDTEYDVFAIVDNRRYSEDRFYTRSVNSDGHGERKQIRFPQGIDTQMEKAVAEVPEYNTVHDLVRDAVLHRLEYLQKRYNLGDGARRMLELERIRADMTRHGQETETMQQAVDDLESGLQKLWDKQDYSLMLEMFQEGSDLHEWLRDPYKSRAVAVLERWKATAKQEIEKFRQMMDEK